MCVFPQRTCQFLGGGAKPLSTKKKFVLSCFFNGKCSECSQMQEYAKKIRIFSQENFLELKIFCFSSNIKIKLHNHQIFFFLPKSPVSGHSRFKNIQIHKKNLHFCSHVRFFGNQDYGMGVQYKDSVEKKPRSNCSKGS